MMVELNVFDSGDALLKAYKSVYDVVFFDIDMPGTNGIETARQIRARDASVAMLFVTNLAQYAINGYEVEAVDYIIKPINYYDFSLKFQKTLRAVQRNSGHSITIETAQGLRTLSTRSIAFIEILGHYLIYHTENEDFKTRGSMERQALALRPYGFCRIHKSYLVNLGQLAAVFPGEVLIGQTKLPVGRAYKNELLQEYMRYLGG